MTLFWSKLFYKYTVMTLFRHNTQPKCATITLFLHMPLFQHQRVIPIAPKHGTLRPSLGPKGPNQRPMVPHLWTPLAQNYYWANSMKPWDATRNLLYLTNELGDSKKGPLERFQGDAVDA